ncbi:helix-turn-helix domain-containing protein [Streptomyces rhizosphaerihabitans]|uniref:helix-turn-helix domain-containing protein n=1 Tax=Streptomyces rhizosphaerihabitans TaxID=1266770 RepID=UPI0021C15BE5|nr:helix-turn-helix transcriptional regulator [Streptomyces rhizosphaerihabitans]MCT9003554.1 helix-turn-helix domain-containing protein [Streptomyces rhizosphaerihabitans]
MATDEFAFAELLLQLRKKAGRTQEEQAAAINTVSGRDTMTRREINRYEQAKNIPTNHTVAHIAVACGLSPEHLQREAAAARAWRRKSARRAGEDQDDVKRRTLLEGAVVGAAAAAEPWERLTHALKKGMRVDSAAAATLVDRASALHVSEGHQTALELQGEVEGHLDAITAALPRAGEYERTMTIAGGETAALAGWVAWDLGDHRRAHAYYKVTMECAEAAGHPPLRALALAYASYGAATPGRAAELLAQAAKDVRGPGNAAASAWVYGRLAEEAASVGDDTNALRALERARFAYDFADHTAEQAWVRFVTPYRMDSLALSVYGQLGRHELAETADHAVDRLGRDLPESGVVVLGDLASALLRGGDLDQGVYVSRQFAAAVEARPNTMGRARAAAIASQLPTTERELTHHLQLFAA